MLIVVATILQVSMSFRIWSAQVFKFTLAMHLSMMYLDYLGLYDLLISTWCTKPDHSRDQLIGMSYQVASDFVTTRNREWSGRGLGIVPKLIHDDHLLPS